MRRSVEFHCNQTWQSSAPELLGLSSTRHVAAGAVALAPDLPGGASLRASGRLAAAEPAHMPAGERNKATGRRRAGGGRGGWWGDRSFCFVRGKCILRWTRLVSGALPPETSTDLETDCFSASLRAMIPCSSGEGKQLFALATWTKPRQSSLSGAVVLLPVYSPQLRREGPWSQVRSVEGSSVPPLLCQLATSSSLPCSCEKQPGADFCELALAIAEVLRA